MNFNLIGTDYGGWVVDISFDTHLIREKNCKIIGIDPTTRSHHFIEKQPDLNNFILLKKALGTSSDDLIEMYKNKNPNHISESILPHHQSVKSFDYYYSETIDLPFLFEKYKNISVIKMDIEGSEYEVIEKLSFIPNSVKQLCIEFHHFCSDKTIDDTRRCIEKLQNLGFTELIEKSSHHQLSEITLWRK